MFFNQKSSGLVWSVVFWALAGTFLWQKSTVNDDISHVGKKDWEQFSYNFQRFRNFQSSMKEKLDNDDSLKHKFEKQNKGMKVGIFLNSDWFKF